jgi:LAGLIDADG DNA endonuclease family protein
MLSPQYVAGLFDGEGMVSLCLCNRRPWKSDPSKRTFQLKFVVGISNTHKPIIELLKRQFNGDISCSNRNSRHKAVWAWKVTGRDTQLKFLTYIRNFVIIKSRQVDLGIQYAKTIGDIGQRTSQADWSLRLAIYNELRSLNRMGHERKHPIRLPNSVRRSAGRNTQVSIAH